MPASSRAVFLSYRREETRHLAGRIADRLVNQPSAVRVFMDVDTIEPGADFAEAIGRGVESCAVLVVLIGPQWSTITDSHGHRRLDDPNDLVALEIQTALEREIRVIPLLVDGARMPDRNELPERLHNLTRRNAIRIDHETFRSDIGVLVETVELALSTPSAGELDKQIRWADVVRTRRLRKFGASAGRWRATFRWGRWRLITVAISVTLGLVIVSTIIINFTGIRMVSPPRVGMERPALISLKLIEMGVEINDLAVSPDARRIYAVASGSRSVLVIDAIRNNVMGEPIPVDGLPVGIVASPEGSRMYVTNSTLGTVSVIDTSSNKIVGEPIRVGASPEAIAVSWEGRRLYVANFKSASVSVIDTDIGAAIGNPINLGATPKSVVVSPDGSRVYVASYGTGTISVIDANSQAIVGSPIKVDGGLDSLALSPDGSRLYVTCSSSGTLAVIDTKDNSVVVDPVKVGREPGGVAVSPHSAAPRVYVANQSSGTVSVIDASTNTVIGPPVEVGISPVDVVVSKDGSRVYVADLSGTVSVLSPSS